MLIETKPTLEINSLSLFFKLYCKDSAVKCPIPSISKSSCFRKVTQGVPPVSALNIKLTYL